MIVHTFEIKIRRPRCLEKNVTTFYADSRKEKICKKVGLNTEATALGESKFKMGSTNTDSRVVHRRSLGMKERMPLNRCWGKIGKSNEDRSVPFRRVPAWAKAG